METIKEKDSIIKLLDALFPNVKIYLFGSRARGTARVTSDIDLALDAGHRLSSLELEKAKNVLSALNIPQSIDVVDLNSVPQAMREMILKEGIKWTI